MVELVQGVLVGEVGLDVVGIPYSVFGVWGCGLCGVMGLTRTMKVGSLEVGVLVKVELLKWLMVGDSL